MNQDDNQTLTIENIEVWILLYKVNPRWKNNIN